MIGDLSAESIAAALTTRRLGRSLLYLERVGSTNQVALEQGAQGAPDGLLVIADEQTAGRGRQERSWWAPAGSSLLMTLLLRPSLDAARVAQLTMCLGLGVVEGIEDVTGLRPALKWPNDVLLDGRKLAGMLSEARLAGDGVDFAALGLGLNVNLELEDPSVPPDVAASAASLRRALGAPVSRLALLVAILARCETWYERLQAGESPHPAWAARLDTLGKQVRVTLPDGTLEGLAAGVSEEGALLLRTGEGVQHVIWAGDITSLRPH